MPNVIIEFKVQYFNSEECSPFEATYNIECATLGEAKVIAKQTIEADEKEAYENGAMMDTFYYEYDFLLEPKYAQSLGLQ